MYTNVFVCVYTYVLVFLCVRVCVCVCVYVSVNVCASMYARIYMCTHIFVCCYLTEERMIEDACDVYMCVWEWVNGTYVCICMQGCAQFKSITLIRFVVSLYSLCFCITSILSHTHMRALAHTFNNWLYIHIYIIMNICYIAPVGDVNLFLSSHLGN